MGNIFEGYDALEVLSCKDTGGSQLYRHSNVGHDVKVAIGGRLHP